MCTNIQKCTGMYSFFLRQGINRVINTKNSGTIVKRANSEDTHKACEILWQKLGDDFEVRIQQPNKRRLKILGIPKNLDKNEMESDINIRNFSHLRGS